MTTFLMGTIQMPPHNAKKIKPDIDILVSKSGPHKDRNIWFTHT